MKELVSPAQILDMQMYSVAPLRDNTMHLYTSTGRDLTKIHW